MDTIQYALIAILIFCVVGIGVCSIWLTHSMFTEWEELDKEWEEIQRKLWKKG